MKFERDGKEKLSLTPHFITNNRVKFKPIGAIDYWTFQADLAKSPFKPLKSRVFEYEDWGQAYIILKIRVYDWNHKPNEIYVATEKEKKFWKRYSDFSTTAVNNRIRDKSWLDPQILSNTSKRWNFNFDARVDELGITDRQECFLEKCDNDMIIKTSTLFDSYYDIHSVYVGWKLYYTVLIPTRSWNKLWLASTSIKWPFTTTEFNKMAKKLYKNARNIESYY